MADTKSKSTPKPKPKAKKPTPKPATPPVYRGSRVKIDGEEFIVANPHGRGVISLEGDDARPPVLYLPSEYELVDVAKPEPADD